MGMTSAEGLTEPKSELTIEPRFTGRTYVAALRVLVNDESAFVSKVDLAKDGARENFAKAVVKRLPAVNAEEVEYQLLRLCDSRASWLEHADKVAAERGSEPTVADLLVQIAFDEAQLCHDDSHVAYATLEIKGHYETWPVRSRGFRLWLRRRLREEHDRSAHPEAVSTAIEEVESKALFETSEVKVFVRLAEHEGAIWLDLADDDWRTVRITMDGWEVVGGKAPVKFIRSRGMLPLPGPERGGCIDDLRQFLNVREETDFLLIVGWLVACLRPRGPFPILNITGEQGAAKSSLARFLRSLVDPNTAPLRSEPREPRDLAISAANSWMVAYDNLSRIPPWLSDALCRLSTGGGFATRELYSDREEVIFDSQRPVMFNGITDVATRSDLLDRSLLISLTAIDEDQRKDERTLNSAFDKARPGILGALLDAIGSGLANELAVNLERLPRMADFALWVTACEEGLGWPTHTFITAYMANQTSANDSALEASIIGLAVQSFMTSRDSWQGTATELLAELERMTDERTLRRKEWPKSPRKASGDLRRIAPNLRAAGLEVSFMKSGKRLIFLGQKCADMGDVDAKSPKSGDGRNICPEKPLHRAPDDVVGVGGILQSPSDAEVIGDEVVI